jgi:hypothetical protein
MYNVHVHCTCHRRRQRRRHSRRHRLVVFRQNFENFLQNMANFRLYRIFS